MNSLVVDGIG